MSKLTDNCCINVLTCGNYAMPGSDYCRECRDKAMAAYRKPETSAIDKHTENRQAWNHKNNKPNKWSVTK